MLVVHSLGAATTSRRSILRPEVFLPGVLATTILLLFHRVVSLCEQISGGLSASWKGTEILELQVGQAWGIWSPDPSDSDWVCLGQYGPDGPVKSQRLRAFCSGEHRLDRLEKAGLSPALRTLECSGKDGAGYIRWEGWKKVGEYLAISSPSQPVQHSPDWNYHRNQDSPLPIGRQGRWKTWNASRNNCSIFHQVFLSFFLSLSHTHTSLPSL